MTELIRWTGNDHGGYLGYAGSLGDWLYQIWKPDHDSDEWVLQSATMPGRPKVRYGDDADELKAAAEELLREWASSLGAAFPEPAVPLTYDGTRCDWDMAVPEDDYEQCASLSRFRVERSDRDPAYQVLEACGAHLAETAWMLMDGDEAGSVTVQARWDA
jgi:hypothetical protein